MRCNKIKLAALQDKIATIMHAIQIYFPASKLLYFVPGFIAICFPASS